MSGDDQITLTVAGVLYEGWISASVTRSLDSFAHSFNLEYTDRWADSQAPWPIRVRSACQLKYGNHILVTGFVDCSSFRVDGESWSLSAVGRSRTGQLVDCSAVYKTGVWRNKTMIQIARDLVSAYGLDVAISVPDPTPIRKFSIEEGESVYNALERLTKNRGYLLHTLADGNPSLLQLQRFVGLVGAAPIDDAISREFIEDAQDRFSDYRTMAQSFSESDEDDETITVTRSVEGIVDETVKLHRPLNVVADSASDYASLRKRATWERNIRAGRSEHYSAVFDGVLDENGFTWTPGDHHRVVDAEFGLDAEMVVVEAKINSSNRELTTAVSFARPEAYSLLEYPQSILNVVTKKGRPKVKKSKVPFGQSGNKKGNK